MEPSALLDEMKALNANISGLRVDLLKAASMIASAHLTATDASRSEVFAHLMDDHLIEIAQRLAAMISAKPVKVAE